MIRIPHLADQSCLRIIENKIAPVYTDSLIHRAKRKKALPDLLGHIRRHQRCLTARLFLFRFRLPCLFFRHIENRVDISLFLLRQHCIFYRNSQFSLLLIVRKFPLCLHMEQTRNRSTGDLQCQMILRRQKDLLRRLIHLQTAELSLVMNHRNKRKTGKNTDNRNHRQKFRQRKRRPSLLFVLSLLLHLSSFLFLL